MRIQMENKIFLAALVIVMSLMLLDSASAKPMERTPGECTHDNHKLAFTAYFNFGRTTNTWHDINIVATRQTRVRIELRTRARRYWKGTVSNDDAHQIRVNFFDKVTPKTAYVKVTAFFANHRACVTRAYTNW